MLDPLLTPIDECGPPLSRDPPVNRTCIGRAVTPLLLLLAWVTPLRAQQDSARLMTAARRASPIDLATSYRGVKQLLELLPMAERGVTIRTPDLTIGPENAGAVRADLAARLAIYEAAIAQRGSANITGAYRAAATASCGRIQSMWAGGIREGVIAELDIVQDRFTIQLTHRFQDQGQASTIEIPGLIVDSAITFADPGNSDFGFVGEVRAGKITVRPDAKAILRGWPDWVPKPSRKDLADCVVTLAPTP